MPLPTIGDAEILNRSTKSDSSPGLATPPDWLPPAARTFLWLHGWRSFRLRRDFSRLRARHGHSVSRLSSLLLEHPDFSRVRRAQQPPSRPRRFLSLESRGVRRFLGLSMRLVELDSHTHAPQSL